MLVSEQLVAIGFVVNVQINSTLDILNPGLCIENNAFVPVALCPIWQDNFINDSYITLNTALA